jgi:hypothetical protein
MRYSVFLPAILAVPATVASAVLTRTAAAERSPGADIREQTGPEECHDSSRDHRSAEPTLAEGHRVDHTALLRSDWRRVRLQRCLSHRRSWSRRLHQGLDWIVQNLKRS